MIKRYIVKAIERYEYIIILFLKKILGTHYLLNQLRLCRGTNIPLILRRNGAYIGKNNNFKGDLNIDNINLKNLTIRNNCYIGKSVFLDLANKIELEDDVVLSTGVTILTHSDVGDRLLKQYYTRVSKPVCIKKGAWLGANVTVLNGVTIGECSIVAAGSIVNKNIPPYTLYAGIPAEKKKDIKS